MKKLISVLTLVSLISGVICTVLYRHFLYGLYLTLSITFFTVFYHFIMRITVAVFVTHFGRNKTAKPFCIGKAEAAFYKKINMKKLKKYAPTYNPDLFSISINSYEELMRNMANARVTHEIIAVLSFVPVLFSRVFDSFTPFFVTSVVSALFDLQFVLIQRYNAARLSGIICRK